MASDAGRSPERLRVLVVDDHEIVRWGFRLILTRQSWVGRCLSAGSGDEALQLACRYRPHVAVVDHVIPGESGADVCARLRDAVTTTRVVLLCDSPTVSPNAARAAGAAGLVSKHWPVSDIAHAVRIVGLGMTVFPRPQRPPGATLSACERQVLELVAAGATNREIALALHLSRHTVKEHTSALYRKLNARNRAQAVQRAQRLGLLNHLGRLVPAALSLGA